MLGLVRTLLVVVIWIEPQNALAGLLETLSTGAYYLSLKSCDSINRDAATEAFIRLENECQCSFKQEPTSALKKISDYVLNSPSDLEHRFFNILGNEYGKDLRCLSKKVEEANSNGEIAAKIPLLRSIRRDLQTHIQQLQSPEVVGKVCPPTLEALKSETDPKLNAPLFNACSGIIRSRTAYEAVMQSIPGSGLPEFRKFLDGESLSSSTGDRRIGLASSRASVQLREMAQDYKVPQDRAQRRLLLSDPGLVQRVIEKSSNPSAMTALACQSDARYGTGASTLENGLMIGSLIATGGAALTARAGSLAYKVIHGATTARAQGLVSARAAGLLQISALAMDSMSAYASIESECMQGRSATQMKGAEAACTEESRQAELHESNCVLSKTLAALQFGVLAASVFRIPKTNNSALPDRVAVVAEREGVRPPEVTTESKTLKGNQRMVDEVKLRTTAGKWPERARQLAKQTVEKRISDLEMSIPFAVRRRPRDAALIQQVEKDLADAIRSANSVRIRELEKFLDDAMSRDLVEALVDREKLGAFISKDSHQHLSRTADFRSRAELDRHLKQIEGSLRENADDSIADWLGGGGRNFDELLDSSRRDARTVLDNHRMARNVRADELAAERRFESGHRRLDATVETRARAQLDRFRAGKPTTDEARDFQIWKQIGKPESNGWIDTNAIARYKIFLRELDDVGAEEINALMGKGDKSFADYLVENGVISRDSKAYRDRAFGNATTAERLPGAAELPSGTTKVPETVSSACPDCPTVMRFQRDPHFDAHIWNRVSNFGRQTRPEVRVPSIAALAKIDREIATKDIAGLADIKKFMEDVSQNIARSKADTTLWTTDKRNWFLENMDRAKWGPPKPGNNPNHVLLTAELNGTKVSIALCIRSPCSAPHLKPGDVATIFPSCGPGVFKVPRVSKIQKSLAALAGETLANNRDFREGLIIENPCK